MAGILLVDLMLLYPYCMHVDYKATRGLYLEIKASDV